MNSMFMEKEVSKVDGFIYEQIEKSTDRILTELDQTLNRLRVERAALVAEKKALDSVKELIDALKIVKE